MELLFECQTNLGGMSGDLRFFQHMPRLHPEPVLVPDGDGDGKGVGIYGSVLPDGGKLRMWYYAMPRTVVKTADASFVAYAESDDGVHWTKPALDVLDDAPPGSNLTNLGLHSATVFIDPDSPSSHRYRGVGCGKAYKNGNIHNIQQRGYYTAHSADGFRWELDAPTPQWPSSDVITSIYHPGRRAGLIALKYTPHWMRFARRSIHTAKFRDGRYTDDVPALYPDEFDDVCAATRGYHSCDYYGMGMMPVGQGTVGFLWKYWHALPYSGGFGSGQQALYGTSDVALVYQPSPGGKWFHVPGRPNFIDHDALPWTRGWVNTASNVIEVGGEQRIYFSGRLMPHGFGLDERWQHTPDHELVFKGSGITFASWPKWRLFGIEALSGGIVKIQLGRIEKASEVFLNYELVRPDGHVRAELTGGGNEPIADRKLEGSVALTGNSTAEKVAWKTGARIQPAQSVRLALHMRFARVYAYEVRPA